MKKLILGAIMLLSTVSFSQTKIMLVNNTGDSHGVEAMFDLKPSAGGEHNYALGAGITTGCDFHSLYGIATKEATKYFNVGAKLGGHSFDPVSINNSHLYYGAVSYIQLNGSDEGVLFGMEYDNLKHFTFGIGYKF